jgi:hypothetical protein
MAAHKIFNISVNLYSNQKLNSVIFYLKVFFGASRRFGGLAPDSKLLIALHRGAELTISKMFSMHAFLLKMPSKAAKSKWKNTLPDRSQQAAGLHR